MVRFNRLGLGKREDEEKRREDKIVSRKFLGLYISVPSP